MKKINYIYTAVVVLLGFACNKNLEEDNYSQLSTEDFLRTEAGIKALSVSAYSNAQFVAFPMNVKVNLGELSTDIMYQRGGGVAGNAAQIYNFTFEPTNAWFREQIWNKCYRAVRDANMLLDNIDEANMTDATRNVYKGEARFLRAYIYYMLFDWFGPVPLVTSSVSKPENITRATVDEMKAFLEKEFTESADQLPVEQSEYGRATKGAALGFLTKYYLNTRQWQKCVEAADKVIDLDQYELYPDYVGMFKVENEINSEFIFVSPANNLAGQGNQWMAVSFPANYPRQSNQASFASNYRLYDDFVNSFAANDKRRGCILTSYTSAGGALVTLLGNNESRSFKYFPDPNSLNADAGNDIPELRYADILLAKAEALNELNGPNDESIQLINEVRDRAGVSLYTTGAFSKETLREAILDERLWEFFTEGFRRQDLLRHNLFISNARARGKDAKDYHVLYPIPQSEIDVSHIEQNDGY